MRNENQQKTEGFLLTAKQTKTNLNTPLTFLISTLQVGMDTKLSDKPPDK